VPAYFVGVGVSANDSHDHGHLGSGTTKSLKASEFKAPGLALLDEVARTGEEVVNSKNGVPVSARVPFREKCNSLFGHHAGHIVSRGDTVAPMDDEWEAAR